MLLAQFIVEIKKENDSIFSDPGFVGSLVGSFLAGFIAVGILAYETYSRKKEANFKSYGTMKAIMARLAIWSEFKLLVAFIKPIENATLQDQDKSIQLLKKQKQ